MTSSTVHREAVVQLNHSKTKPQYSVVLPWVFFVVCECQGWDTVSLGMLCLQAGKLSGLSSSLMTFYQRHQPPQSQTLMPTLSEPLTPQVIPKTWRIKSLFHQAKDKYRTVLQSKLACLVCMWIAWATSLT